MLKDFFTTLGTGALNKVLHAVLVLVIGLLIIRVVTKLLQGGLDKSNLEKAAHSLILSLAKVGRYILLGLCVAVVMVCIPMRIYGIIAIPFFIVPALSAFMYTYAAWPVIRKYMIDPVEKKPAEAPAEP